MADPLFFAGTVFVSPNVLNFLNWEKVDELVGLHIMGDFGKVNEEKKEENIRAINKRKGKIASLYTTGGWNVLISTSLTTAITSVVFEAEKKRWKM